MKFFFTELRRMARLLASHDLEEEFGFALVIALFAPPLIMYRLVPDWWWLYLTYLVLFALPFAYRAQRKFEWSFRSRFEPLWPFGDRLAVEHVWAVKHPPYQDWVTYATSPELAAEISMLSEADTVLVLTAVEIYSTGRVRPLGQSKTVDLYDSMEAFKATKPLNRQQTLNWLLRTRNGQSRVSKRSRHRS